MSGSHSRHLLPSLTPDRTLQGVNNEIPSIVLFIDQTIKSYEDELTRLRKARAELVSPDGRRNGNNKGRQIPASGDGLLAESIGELLIEALGVRGSLTVKQIHEWITAKGKFAKYHTVSSMVNYYYRQKYIKRIAVGTYVLGDKSPPIKRAPNPTLNLTNGAPVPKNGIP
jgi:hypothetical protein